MYVQPNFVLVSVYVWIVCVQVGYVVGTGWHSSSLSTWHICASKYHCQIYAKCLFAVSIHLHQELKTQLLWEEQQQDSKLTVCWLFGLFVLGTLEEPNFCRFGFLIAGVLLYFVQHNCRLYHSTTWSVAIAGVSASRLYWRNNCYLQGSSAWTKNTISVWECQKHGQCCGGGTWFCNSVFVQRKFDHNRENQPTGVGTTMERSPPRWKFILWANFSPENKIYFALLF